MKYSHLTKGAACALALSVSVSAQVLMLDFGPTLIADTPSLTNSPYHTAAGGAFTDTIWNKVSTADVAAGNLKWSNDTTAAGVSLNLGATTADGVSLIGLGNTPSGSTMNGSTINSGVYANTSAGRDGIFTGANSSSSRYLGAQIGGLAAGTYDIYITGRNTNTASGQTHNFYAGKSGSAGDFDASLLSTKAVTFFAEPTTQEDVWSGSGGLANYAKFTVTLSSGEFLNLAARGGTGDARGFINLIQIVNVAPVPEPSAFAFLAGLLGLGAAACTRRRRHA